jgi:hypothetical protein
METEEIKFQIEELILKCHIRPSSSPCRSPIVSVKKKDIYYKSLNNITVKN